MRTETVARESKQPPYTSSFAKWYRAISKSNFGGETAKFLPECKAKFGRLLDPSGDRQGR